jgi:carbamoyltransferase
MKKIFSAAMNMHDHNTYDGVFHRQEERYSRRKHNIALSSPLDPTPSRDFFLEQFLPGYKKSLENQIFAFTYSNLGKEFVLDLLTETLGETDFLNFKPTTLWDSYQTENYYYIDHHQSHAAYAFLSSGFKESDVLAIDGAGPSFTCIFIDRQGVITDLSSKLSIGGLWNRLSQDIGFGYLEAGKTMGLAGFGQYNQDVYDLIQDYLKSPIHRLSETAKKIIRTVPKEDTAYTLQRATIDLIKKIVYPLKTSDNICVSGGVAYNGYMNEELTKYYVNVHVPPAVGDEGQAIGTYMHADYMINRNVHIPTVYAGHEHTVDETIFRGLDYDKKPFDEIAKQVSAAIASGKIVGWYQGKSESGNRALGNRSILADPRNPEIKNIINRTIKKREDFRPFAPSVLEEHYQDYFDTNQPSPFMSRIVAVKSNEIPGVTHVDNTARIQTVSREFNQRFYDVINEFYKITGIPMLLNTSFNCQGPIVETPEQALRTFFKTDLDLLVINDFIVRKQV